IARQPIDVLRRAAHLKKQQRQHHHLYDKRYRRDDAEEFEPELHRRPTRPTRRRNPVLPSCRVPTTSIRADRLRDRLRPPPRWNPFCALQLPCCARSVHLRAREVREPSSARNPCLHRPSLQDSREYPRRFSARRESLPALQLPALRGNKSPWILHCPP